MTPSIRPQGDFGATVGRCFGLMIAAKRPIEPPSSPQGLQSKRSKADNDAASSTSITSSMSNTASDSVARQFLLSDQHHRVRIYTQFSEVSFFRGLPWLSVAAVSYMEVITVNYSPPPRVMIRLRIVSSLGVNQVSALVDGGAGWSFIVPGQTGVQNLGFSRGEQLLSPARL